MRHIRPVTFALASFAALAATPSSAFAYDMPYDPYPWCAVYTGESGGASNCGFLTIEQCRATVSGMGGFCERNQFYNPRTAARSQRQR